MAVKHNVEEVADLACLKLSAEEAPVFQDNFNKVLDYFTALGEVDTNGVEPMVTPHDESVELRQDQVKNALNVDEILQNAPEVKDNMFKVPPVV